MNLLKCNAVTLTTVTLMMITSSVANAQSRPYLTRNNLRNAISGQTLIGNNWAEFYQADGATIFGKARRNGRIYEYTGTWTAENNRICYSYPQQHGQSAYSGCSRLTLNYDQTTQTTRITHFCDSVDIRQGCWSVGQQKSDGVATRYSGNALDRFGR